MNRLLICLIFFGCSGVRKTELLDMPKGSESKFEFSDASGKFGLRRKNVYKEENELYTSIEMFEGKAKNKANFVEKTVMAGILGRMEQKSNEDERGNKKKKSESILILRPKASQHAIWLDGQKFVTQLRVNVENRLIEVSTQSPDKKNVEKKSIPFPKKNSLFCFLEQVPECLRVTGFIRKSIQNKSGRINFYVIWTSYPFQQDQFSNVNPELFSPASLEYDGNDDEGLVRFSLQVQEQTLFFHFDLDGEFSKMFWVAQGLSMIKNNP